uniref:Uncharacterized protein n=1 Tax=Arundo donax TaxID=35708 RepID=A0A0A8XSR9_ARUDO
MVVGVMPLDSAAGFLPSVRGSLPRFFWYALDLVQLFVDVISTRASGLVIPKICCCWWPFSLLGRSLAFVVVADPPHS